MQAFFILLFILSLSFAYNLGDKLFRFVNVVSVQRRVPQEVRSIIPIVPYCHTYGISLFKSLGNIEACLIFC